MCGDSRLQEGVVRGASHGGMLARGQVERRVAAGRRGQPACQPGCADGGLIRCSTLEQVQHSVPPGRPSCLSGW